MSLNTRYPVRGLAATMFFCTALPVTADITGTIDATITLTSGCVINSGNEMDGASGVSFGSLDFGTQPTLFTSADSQVTGGAHRHRSAMHRRGRSTAGIPVGSQRR